MKTVIYISIYVTGWPITQSEKKRLTVFLRINFLKGQFSEFSESTAMLAAL